jgi:hypothetical protein
MAERAGPVLVARPGARDGAVRRRDCARRRPTRRSPPTTRPSRTTGRLR